MLNVVIALLVGSAVGWAVWAGVPRLVGLRRRWSTGMLAVLAGSGAALFAALVTLRGPEWWHAGVLLAVLLGITASDFAVKLIPDSLSLGGAVIGVLVSTLLPTGIVELLAQGRTAAFVGLPSAPHLQGLVLAVSGAVLGFVVLEAARIGFSAVLGVAAMGMGDSKLMLAIGAFIGPLGVLFAFVVACPVGIVIALVLRLRTGLPHAPFGPGLAAGGVAVLLASNLLIDGFAAFQRLLVTLPLYVVFVVQGILVAIAIVLLVRLRRRASEVEQLIEDDYARIDQELEP
ncbi:MAG: A24 family peptidase [Acidobacteriota bacterium]